MNIIENGYYAYFEHDGCQYFADVSKLKSNDDETECLIFLAKNKQVVEWRKDNHAFILGDRSLARLVRWRDDGSSYQPDGKGWKYAVLSVGDMYVENTEYIPLANLHFIPEAL